MLCPSTFQSKAVLGAQRLSVARWLRGFEKPQRRCGAGSQPAPLLQAWHSAAPARTHQRHPAPGSDLPQPGQLPSLVLLLPSITGVAGAAGGNPCPRTMPAPPECCCHLCRHCRLPL